LPNDPVLVQDAKRDQFTTGVIQEQSMEDLEDGVASSQQQKLSSRVSLGREQKMLELEESYKKIALSKHSIEKAYDMVNQSIMPEHSGNLADEVIPEEQPSEQPSP
jgi:hypothetical protein